MSLNIETTTDKRMESKATNILHDTLDRYTALNNTEKGKRSALGVQLPNFSRGGLTVQVSTLGAEQIIEKIAQFNAKDGWVQYGDQLMITTGAPAHRFFIEGEWSNGRETLHVVQNGHDYIVRYLDFSDTSEQQVYCEQTLLLRASLGEPHQVATYRLFYTLASDGERNGRWYPSAQQFVGFSAEKEANA